MGTFVGENYPGSKFKKDISSKIDSLLKQKAFSIPVFLGIIFLLFFLTFILGNYPVMLVEQIFVWLETSVKTVVEQNLISDMVVDGIIPGIGGVAAFIPNIVILFTLIAILEDSGYMARASLVVENIMNKIGLNAKSFIPLVIGFGCNVPAIMATRSIENKSKRLITILIIPFMSCSARLPVYVLFISAFFDSYRTIILFVLYLIGIVIGGLSAMIFSKFTKVIKIPEISTDLPPLRLPSIRSVLSNMWSKSLYFVKKMGGVILIASIVIWALSYLPMKKGEPFNADLIQTESPEININNSDIQLEQSYIGLIGKRIAPVFEPLGFDWQMSVSIITGLPAKEIIVSTLAVLYNKSDESDHLIDIKTIWRSNSAIKYPSLSALSFMLFVLISFPCIGTLISIRKETNSYLWMGASFLYTTFFAWLVSYFVYQLGSFILKL